MVFVFLIIMKRRIAVHKLYKQFQFKYMAHQSVADGLRVHVTVRYFDFLGQ